MMFVLMRIGAVLLREPLRPDPWARLLRLHHTLVATTCMLRRSRAWPVAQEARSGADHGLLGRDSPPEAPTARPGRTRCSRRARCGPSGLLRSPRHAARSHFATQKMRGARVRTPLIWGLG